jgi:hypothetical protein
MVDIIWRTKGHLRKLGMATVAAAYMLCIATNANAGGYEVTLVGYKGNLKEIAFEPSLWNDIVSNWGLFVIPGKDNPPVAKVISARRGTLTKGDFSREVLRLECTSAEEAARIVKGLNGSVIRSDGLGIGFIWIGNEITFFEGPPATKKVEIRGYKGTMAEISAFAVSHVITHGAWARFVDDGLCHSLEDYGWEYATTGTLAKGRGHVFYACVRLRTPETTSRCLQNTDQLFEDTKNHYLLVSQLGNKLLFMSGNVPKKDMLALVEAIPEVQGFDPN